MEDEFAAEAVGVEGDGEFERKLVNDGRVMSNLGFLLGMFNVPGDSLAMLSLEEANSGCVTGGLSSGGVRKFVEEWEALASSVPEDRRWREPFPL